MEFFFLPSMVFGLRGVCPFMGLIQINRPLHESNAKYSTILLNFSNRSLIDDYLRGFYPQDQGFNGAG